MLVLAVAAHPDDVEILCAGSLARFARDGHEVAVAHFTTGDKGGQKEDVPADVARVRWAEAERSVTMIGAAHYGGWYPDLEIYSDSLPDDPVDDLLRELRPDLVIAHAPNDYHADHRAASRLTHRSVCRCREGGVSIGAMWYMDTLSSLDFVPDFFVDVTSTFETKLEMVEAHESQVAWMRAHRGLDMTDIVRSSAWFRGVQARVPLAEAFQKVTTAGITDGLSGGLEEYVLRGARGGAA